MFPSFALNPIPKSADSVVNLNCAGLCFALNPIPKSADYIELYGPNEDGFALNPIPKSADYCLYFVFAMGALP